MMNDFPPHRTEIYYDKVVENKFHDFRPNPFY